MGIYLGLDSSTQSLSAFVIDTDKESVIYTHSVNFGERFPDYNSPGGFLNNDDPAIVHADPKMWLDALDLLLKEIVDGGFDLSNIDGISGSGQQHGSVYLADGYLDVLGSLSGDQSLSEQLGGVFARPTSPIWMDSSTGDECAEINTSLGGASVVMARSGSAAIERFTGPQIRRFYKTEPAAYAATKRIHLVSSFLASVLVGDDAAIDFGDGAGMNLFNLKDQVWDSDLLDATAPGLEEKLPPVEPSNTIAGTLCPYFVEKYGFRAIPVNVFSGDNPNSLIGVGAALPGTAVISLGTSDTFFCAMHEPVTDPNGCGHVFGNPAGGNMSLICFRNGSLARERVKEQFNLSWEEFDVTLLQQTDPGNGDNLMLPFFESEITPRRDAGVVCVGDDDFVNGNSPAKSVRAVLESQFLNMKVNSEWISDQPETIRITGGASKSDGIARIIADVFGARVERLTVSNSAALGAAMRAANAVGGDTWESLTDSFAKVEPGKSVEPVTPGAYVDKLTAYKELLGS